MTPPPKEAFTGLNAQKLQFTHSDIVCNIHDCEINSLIFQQKTPNHRHLSWKFEYNRCISSHTLHLIPHSAICKNATEIITENGLLCQRRLELEECICISESGSIKVSETKSSILTIGDCESVLLPEKYRSKLRALYLYRIQSISIKSLPETLQKLEILHSTIRFEASNLLQNINEIKLSGTIVEEISPKAFENGFIKSLTFNQSVL
uniref:Uncharacterized protein n=1 Tax=Panagrolaimus davidi TaxID=227884 RepID=A0A914Q841_9BILA